MRACLTRFLRDDRGPTAVEYAVLTIFIAMAFTVGAGILGTNLNMLFGKVGSAFSNVPALPKVP